MPHIPHSQPGAEQISPCRLNRPTSVQSQIPPVTVSAFARMVAEGKIIPATRTGPILMPTIPGDGNAVSAALHAMREEERW